MSSESHTIWRSNNVIALPKYSRIQSNRRRLARSIASDDQPPRAFADLFPRAKGSLEDAKVPFAVPFFMKHRRDCNTQQKHNHPQAARRAPKLTGARVSMKAKFGRGSLNLNATQFGPKTKKSLRVSVWARTRSGGKNRTTPHRWWW